MIRYGKVCKTCTATKCHDLPDPREGGSNTIEGVTATPITIEGCPNRWVGRDAIDFIHACELTRKGLPPVSGGQLDQTRCFTEAYAFWLHLRDQYESERNPFNDGD